MESAAIDGRIVYVQLSELLQIMEYTKQKYEDIV